MAVRLRYACESDTSGYATAGRRLFEAIHLVSRNGLRDDCLELVWEPLADSVRGRCQGEPQGGATPLMLSMQDDAPSDINVLHVIPHAWTGLRQALGTGHYIGHTVWEADVLPTRWQTELVAADEYWVPCEWNAESFEAHAPKRPTHVVPHVCDTGEPAPIPERIPEDRFVFVSITTWDWRKRPDLVINAYLQAFRSDDPVVLLLKTGPWPTSWPGPTRPVWQHVLDAVRRHGSKAPEIILNTDNWTDSQVRGLLGRADAHVSMSCAEGWGLGTFDAATIGTPVIITGHGGQLDYLGEDYPGLLPYRRVRADHPDASMFEPHMWWALADEDAAIEQMRALVAGTSPVPDAASRLAPILRTRFSPEVVGRIALEALR